jgi:Ca-activated chloride channel homolog
MPTHLVRWLAVVSLAIPSLGAAPASMRPVAITGTVTEHGTGTGVAAVSVVVQGTTRGVVTDSAGRYRITIEAASDTTVRLVARRIGYAIATTEVRIRAGVDSVRADIALQRTVAALEAVVAQGYSGATAGRQVRLRGAASIARTEEWRVGAAKAVDSIDRTRRPDNTESYAAIVDNPFLAARANPLSTFSVDVDRAAYANVRRFVTSGQRPPKDAVRIEELVNYFPYAYPEPGAEHPVSVTTDVTRAPWHREHLLLRVGLRARSVDMRAAPPSNLVFLLDVSGSMQSPQKLPLVKQSLRLLVDQLREDDRVAMVVYAGSAGLVLESTTGDRKREIMEAIDRLEAGGSTAGGAGIRLAYDVAARHHIAEGNNRVILATDGDFNVGASSDAEMIRLIEEKRKQGTFLTVLGFGMGNIKDSKLEQIADKGNGNYAYIDNLLEARKVLVTEMGGTLLTVAKDVKLQLEFNPARVAAYRLIGYENRLLAAEDFADDTKDAGEMGAGHTVTALYELIPVGASDAASVRVPDSLRYQTTTPRAAAATSGELLTVKLRYKTPDGSRSRLLERIVPDYLGPASDDVRFAAAVAAWGMLLRDSEHRGTATFESVLALAEGAVGADPAGYRREFVDLVRKSAAVAELAAK